MGGNLTPLIYSTTCQWLCYSFPYCWNVGKYILSNYMKLYMIYNS